MTDPADPFWTAKLFAFPSGGSKPFIRTLKRNKQTKKWLNVNLVTKTHFRLRKR